MNSTNFVHSSIGIPAAPSPEANSSLEVGSSTKAEKGNPVPAIIRPIPRESGREGSLRIDAASSGPEKPHVRTNQLDDYVKWLRAKIKSDQADARKVAQARNPQTAEPPQQAPTIQSPITPELTSQQHVLPGSHFSTVTTQAGLTGQDLTGQDLTGQDLTGQDLTGQDLTGQDLTGQELTGQELTGQELTGQELTGQDLTGQDLTGADDISASSLQRIDQPHRFDGGLPAAHTTFSESSLINPKDLPHDISVESNQAPGVIETDITESLSSETRKLTAEDTESFISSVSKAIASVLTDTPEPAFEQKIRTHFESELHARAIQSIATPTEVNSVDKMDRTVLADLADVGGNPIQAMQSEADQIASEVLNGSQKEIPTSVAAWDVEDFRWPLVTNQMIVSGSEAIDQLAKSTFEMISPSKQRIAIAGLGRGEGTTSIAISLARWSAACGNNVLLVDADLVTPSLSSRVGLAPNLSWINAVSQSLAPSEVIVRSQSSNLCVMPLAQMASRVTWPRFIYDNLGEVISKVQSHFDLIILDVGPANQLMAELSRPGLLVDATLLVHDGADSPEFKKTKSRLEEFGLSKFIVAQNRAHLKSINVA